MVNLRSPRYSITIARRATPVLAVLLVLFSVPVMAIGTTSEAAALAGDPVVKPEAEKDTKCLKCHSRDKTKTLEDGEEMSLQVPLSEYASAAHSKEGCTSCHKVIANKNTRRRSTGFPSAASATTPSSEMRCAATATQRYLRNTRAAYMPHLSHSVAAQRPYVRIATPPMRLSR